MARVGLTAIAAFVASVLIAGGCGSDESSDGIDSSGPSVAPTTIAATSSSATQSSAATPTTQSTTTATTVTSSTSSGPPPTIPAGDGPEAACAPGEQPMVFAYDQTTGSLRWARCSSETLVPMVVGATEELVYAVLTKENKSDMSKASARLVALETGTGAERWGLDVGPFATVPEGSFAGSGVLITWVDDTVVGVDAADGTIRWRLPGTFFADAVAVASDTVVVVADPSVVPAPTVVTLGPNGEPPPLTMGQGYSAFDRATGTKKLWSQMVLVPQSEDPEWGSAAIDQDIAVLWPGPAGLDVNTGAVLWNAAKPVPGGAAGHNGAIVFVGQDDPVTVLNASTGEEMWTAPGHTPYDDVHAIGDAAVYVLDGSEFVAYELESGTVRWRQPQDSVQLTRPWLATEETMFTMWWNLEARATDTGAVRWTTTYPTKAAYVDGPRMASIARNSDLVAVGFVSGSLGGD